MLALMFQEIEDLGVVRLIVAVPWIYPAISALHIIGIGTLLGSIVAVDLRLLRVLGPQFDEALPALVRMALRGLALAATTGLLLLSVRIANYAENPVFLIKMMIIAAAGGNALLLRQAGLGVDLAVLVGRRAVRFSGALSLCLWVSAVFAGRWIAFS
ncbi:hypothetical protein [Rhizobium laguerreae]|uniref:hypothetical protein n=1 Tax=Rhizobium laguerreae TaxID=1076926 RepID=UPI001C928614|nr:hypothetical protein [Rhizobium laguerreae]MBY3136706.1 hypothetical protein [Rhizobium laguerreae]MBY3447894.1 hypothetical protein [Rhizobium laguerreae]